MAPANELIRHCFQPRVLFLTTPDVEAIARKNGLEFVELLRPFCRVDEPLHFSDHNGNRLELPPPFRFQSSSAQHSSSSPNPASSRAKLSELVSRLFSTDDEDDQTTGGPTSVWFNAFQEKYIGNLPIFEHEYVRSNVAIVLAVTTGDDPLGKLRELSQLASSARVSWLSPSYYKYFLLVHDESLPSEPERATPSAMLQTIETAFGATNCQLLRLNSRSTALLGSAPEVPNVWQTSATVLPVTPQSEHGGLEHPLAAAADETDDHVVPTGSYLSAGDLDAIRQFTYKFVRDGLIPYAERQIRLLNDHVSSRRALHRSIFSATKKLFAGTAAVAGGKSTSASMPASLHRLPTQVSYGDDCVQVHTRRLADIAFVFGLFDLAYNMYHVDRRDFSSDQAWLHYAGASEMCALAALMAGGGAADTAKSFPMHYLDSALGTYRKLAAHAETSSPALRCGLFAAIVRCQLGLVGDAAGVYNALVGLESDLASALCLEQASRCYALAIRPARRKGAFCLVLAAHYFARADHRRHALFCLQRALERVYDQSGWIATRRSIWYSMAQQHTALGDYRHASECLVDMLRLGCTTRADMPGKRPGGLLIRKLHAAILQQLATQRKRAGIVEPVSPRVPLIDVAKVVVHAAANDVVEGSSTPLGSDDTWESMQRLAATAASHPQLSVVANSKSSRHVGYVGEPISFTLTLFNPLAVPLRLDDVRLKVHFTADQPIATGFVAIEQLPIPSVSLSAHEDYALQFTLHALVPGILRVESLRYRLNCEESAAALLADGCEANGVAGDDAHANDMAVDCQAELCFDAQADTRTDSVVEGEAQRDTADWPLQWQVRPATARISIAFDESFPKTLDVDQLSQCRLLLSNKSDGCGTVDDLIVCSSPPDSIVFELADGSYTHCNRMFALASGEERSCTVLLRGPAPTADRDTDVRLLALYRSRTSSGDEWRTARVLRRLCSNRVMSVAAMGHRLDAPPTAGSDSTTPSLLHVKVSHLGKTQCPLEIVQFSAASLSGAAERCEPTFQYRRRQLTPVTNDGDSSILIPSGESRFYCFLMGAVESSGDAPLPPFVTTRLLPHTQAPAEQLSKCSIEIRAQWRLVDNNVGEDDEVSVIGVSIVVIDC